MLIALASILGVLIDAGLGATIQGQSFWLLLVGMTAALAAIAWYRSHPTATICFVVLLFVPVGGMWERRNHDRYKSASILALSINESSPAILDGFVDTPAVLRRHPLADQPSRRDQSPWQTQLTLTVTASRVGQSQQSVSGRVLVVVDGRCDHFKPSDAVRVYGSLRQFDGPTNPGERDLRNVYRRKRLHARMNVDAVDQIESIAQTDNELSHWKTIWLSASRIVAIIGTKSRDLLLRHTGPSTGPLAVALVIGQRDFVNSDTRDLLLVTGTAHLLSVSGLHLAIIVVLASLLATIFNMPPSIRIAWIIGVCLMYTAITGGRPPVMRAAVLVATFMIAIWIRRPSQPINTLSLAALVLIFLNPEYVFGIGVQLSFLAVATLVLCGRRGENNSTPVEQTLRQEERLRTLVETSRSKPIFYLRYAVFGLSQLAWFSGCVTAISIPLVWYQFHVVSLVSVFTNVVLSPFLFVALSAGVGTIVFGFIAPLGFIFGYVCDVALQCMRWIIEFAASIPAGHFWLPAPPSWWVAIFYLVIVASLFFRTNRRASTFRYVWIVLWILIALLMATSKPDLPQDGIEATFVDVGHGTSVVIRFAENDTWLYDCGRLGNDLGSSRDIDDTLWSLGVTHLNGVVLSHADSDHFNALPGLLRRFSIEKIVTPPGMLDEPEPALVAVRAAIEHWDVPIKESSLGDSIPTLGSPMKVLHPPAIRLRGSDNANSLVILIDCGGTSMILPGDLEPPGTAVLLAQPRPPAGGVLMAPHHGSLAMDAASVLQWSRPSETAVSGGQRAGRPEVHQMLSQFGSGVHVTSQVGAVRVTINRAGIIEVRTWSQSAW